ncbi:ABC transporter substrate-binding protein [Paenibacillus turpanensis]|uniref:ABC transporter substrate-binding protein n=1 Tax=Paenibacillus turpanensis TaxID=2689078 RepID=UPI001408DB7C|nr:iron-siderophore ABC transporter substrate-binding protein [Paenibacillus turpanensis]
MVRTKKNSSWLSFSMLLVIVFSLVLSACGQPETTKTPAGEGAAKQGESAAPKEQTPPAETKRVVKHSMGETELTGTPKRVVVLTQEGTEAVLELGVKPVGAVNSGLGDTWFPHIASEMQGVTELGDEAQPNLELIVSLKPDLILGNKVRHEKIYNQLKDIAPTVLSADLAGKWKENFNLYAEALNKKQEGEKAMAAYDAKIKEAKDKLGAKTAKQVSIVRFLPNAVRIYQKDTFAGVILKDIGFARPAAQDKDQFMEVITKERIADMDGDIMFYFNADYDEKKGGTKNQEEWMKDPLYTNLKVAKNNMAFKVDEVTWNLSGGIKSAKMLVDEVVKYGEKLK